MAIFSTNQNRHLFVAERFVDSYAEVEEGQEKPKFENLGDITLKFVGGNANGKGKCLDDEFYFEYMGPDGPIKSPLIQVKNVNYIKAKRADKLRTPLKTVVVYLDPEVNDGAPVAGQDYLLRIVFRQFFGMSDEDQYFKDAVVHATSTMTAEKLLTKMVESLNRCFSREVGATKDDNPYLDFEVSTTSIPDPDDEEETISVPCLIITEKEQQYIRGVASKERVLFDVYPTTVLWNTDDFVWGKVEDKTKEKFDNANPSTYIGNGASIADLEYFCMGERGDQYRMMGWPNIVPTTYLVDPSKEYDVLEIHFGFTDTGVNSYRSEKDITIVSSKDSLNVLNPIISALNDEYGFQVSDVNQ